MTAKTKTKTKTLDSKSPLAWDLVPVDLAEARQHATLASGWAPEAAGSQRHQRAQAAHELAAEMAGKNLGIRYYHQAEARRHARLAAR